MQERCARECVCSLLCPVTCGSIATLRTAACQSNRVPCNELTNANVRLLQVGPGDVVVVSGAAGSVGLVAAQLARRAGASAVVGITGTEVKEKRLVNEVGLNAALTYKGRFQDLMLRAYVMATLAECSERLGECARLLYRAHASAVQTKLIQTSTPPPQPSTLFSLAPLPPPPPTTTAAANTTTNTIVLRPLSTLPPHAWPGCTNVPSVYFDNVGGLVSDAVIQEIGHGGRVVVCGQISMYNTDEVYPPPVSPDAQAVIDARGIHRERYLVLDYAPQFASSLAELCRCVNACVRRCVCACARARVYTSAHLRCFLLPTAVCNTTTALASIVIAAVTGSAVEACLTCHSRGALQKPPSPHRSF
jgi:hypothetical protein